MFDFLNTPLSNNIDLKQNLKSGFWIGLGVFLFILFFQPFEIKETDFDNYILLMAGFGGITFIITSIVKQFIQWFLHRFFGVEGLHLKGILILHMVLWILISLAFTFYLHYVGHVLLSMYIVFKIVLLGMFPPVLNMLITEIDYLQSQVLRLHQNNRKLTREILSLTGEKDQIIELASDNRSEKLKLDIDALIQVKSAENYVEIIFWENQNIHRKLLRATLKNMEDQMKAYPEIIRCHRTCIVNLNQVDKLHKSPEGFRLIIKDYEEHIPVSRQYLLGVKNALDNS